MSDVRTLLVADYRVNNPEEPFSDDDQVEAFLFWNIEAPPPAPPPPEARHPIRNDDEKLADQIRRKAWLLLVSPRHQDAVGRWTYAANGGDCPAAQQIEGSRLLRIIRRRSAPGRPKNVKHSPEELKYCFDQVYEYGSGVYQYLESGQPPKKIDTIFPDIGEIESLGISYRDHAPNQKPPAPALIAEKFVQAVTGYSRGHLRKLLKLAESDLGDLRKRNREPYQSRGEWPSPVNL